MTPGRLNLGELPPGGKAVGSISIRNRGTTPIRIARFETSCPCVRVLPSSLDLKADETQEITVAFDSAEEPEFRGSLGVTLEGRGTSKDVVFRTTVEVGVAGDAKSETVKDLR